MLGDLPGIRRLGPDDADAHVLADIALRDPLMCLRVLLNASRRFGHPLVAPSQTVTAALVLTGVDPFFRDCVELPVLEERLAGQPLALAGALAAIDRAHAAARLAAAIAIHRQDEQVERLHQAALLSDFPRLLLWCEAPELVLEMQKRQRHDPALRSADVQREVLGVELDALAAALVDRWQLPDSLRELTESRHADRPGPWTMRLAVRIARHLQSGWHDPALPDDFVALAALLNVKLTVAASLVRRTSG